MLNLLGGKGANLAEMSSIGLPVPPGFTITTEVCNQYTQNNKSLPEGLKDHVISALTKVEEIIRKRFGEARKSSFGKCAFWCPSLYARDDGYGT